MNSEDGSDQFVFRDKRPVEQLPNIKGKDSEGKERVVPSSFMNWNQRLVPVYSEYVPYEGEKQKWQCPRDGYNTVQVNTARGIMLYCFDCGIFYDEYGNWGYKK
jgi:hypothetical protein